MSETFIKHSPGSAEKLSTFNIVSGTDTLGPFTLNQLKMIACLYNTNVFQDMIRSQQVMKKVNVQQVTDDVHKEQCKPVVKSCDQSKDIIKHQVVEERSYFHDFTTEQIRIARQALVNKLDELKPKKEDLYKDNECSIVIMTCDKKELIEGIPIRDLIIGFAIPIKDLPYRITGDQSGIFHDPSTLPNGYTALDILNSTEERLEDKAWKERTYDYVKARFYHRWNGIKWEIHYVYQLSKWRWD